MMTETLLAHWRANAHSNINATIVPDGCRDLIVKIIPGECPKWHVSQLYDQSTLIKINAGSSMMGFRLKPGVQIDEDKLLASLSENHLDWHDIVIQLQNFTHRTTSVEEALYGLALEVTSTKNAAKEMGVHQRTLQRLLLRKTGRSPVYWMMLARVRRAARAVSEPTSLVEIADRLGYADQAHMSREFRRWLNISPSALRRRPDIIQQLNASGYD